MGRSTSNKSRGGGKKHPTPHKGIRNPDRANGKAWKRSHNRKG